MQIDLSFHMQTLILFMVIDQLLPLISYCLSIIRSTN